MAICRPLTVPRRLSKMARAGWALVAIWISSVLFSLPWLYYNKVRTIPGFRKKLRGNEYILLKTQTAPQHSNCIESTCNTSVVFDDSGIIIFQALEVLKVTT